MRVPVCGRLGPNEGGVVGYVDRMRAKFAAKWGVHLMGMNFQTRSRNKQKQVSFSHRRYLLLILSHPLDFTSLVLDFLRIFWSLLTLSLRFLYLIVYLSYILLPFPRMLLFYL